METNNIYYIIVAYIVGLYWGYILNRIWLFGIWGLQFTVDQQDALLLATIQWRSSADAGFQVL